MLENVLGGVAAVVLLAIGWANGYARGRYLLRDGAEERHYQALTDAWDQGYEAGRPHAHETSLTRGWMSANPYREPVDDE